MKIKKISSPKSFMLHALVYTFGLYALILALNEILAVIGNIMNSGTSFAYIIYYIDKYGIIVAFLTSFIFLWPDVDKTKRKIYMSIFLLIFLLIYYFDFMLRYS